MKKLKIVLGILCAAVVILGVAYRNSRNETRDFTPPIITAKEDTIKVKIGATDEELIKGLSAKDDVDGDLTEKIIIEKIAKNEKSLKQEFNITYVCFDSSENIGRLTRKLIYEDYNSPHFSLDSDLRFPLNTTINLLDHIKATDAIDGEISPFIILEGAKDIGEASSAGNYSFNLSVTNSVGDTSTLPIQVELYEETYEEQMYKPKIMLKEYVVYIDKKHHFKPEAYLDYIEDEGRCEIDFDNQNVNAGATKKTGEKLATKKIPVSKIETKSTVKKDKPGVYSVTYKYTSDATGYDCKTKLIVVVE